MKIEKVTFRNFGSYGNRTLVLEMPPQPSFYLVHGDNGNGKCLHPSTNISVSLNVEELEKFQAFLTLYRSKE